MKTVTNTKMKTVTEMCIYVRPFHPHSWPKFKKALMIIHKLVRMK